MLLVHIAPSRVTALFPPLRTQRDDEDRYLRRYPRLGFRSAQSRSDQVARCLATCLGPNSRTRLLLSTSTILRRLERDVVPFVPHLLGDVLLLTLAGYVASKGSTTGSEDAAWHPHTGASH